LISSKNRPRFNGFPSKAGAVEWRGAGIRACAATGPGGAAPGPLPCGPGAFSGAFSGRLPLSAMSSVSEESEDADVEGEESEVVSVSESESDESGSVDGSESGSAPDDTRSAGCSGTTIGNGKSSGSASEVGSESGNGVSTAEEDTNSVSIVSEVGSGVSTGAKDSVGEDGGVVKGEVIGTVCAPAGAGRSSESDED
jgi:hypothetical protein